MPVIDFFAKTPFTQDVYVKALEVRPGTPGVVHHAGPVCDRSPARRRDARQRPHPRRGRQADVAQPGRARQRRVEHARKSRSCCRSCPGRGYEEYQGDAGQLIKAGSYIDFYMHYTPTGTPAEGSDRSSDCISPSPGRTSTHQIYHSLRRRRSDDLHRRRQGVRAAAPERDDPNSDEGGVNLPNIPPYAENWKVVSVHTITRADYALRFHTAHARARQRKAWFKSPFRTGAKRDGCLDIPKYDFNWQNLLRACARPMKIRAGSTIAAHGLTITTTQRRTVPIRRLTRKCSGPNRAGTKCTRRRRASPSRLAGSAPDEDRDRTAARSVVDASVP